VLAACAGHAATSDTMSTTSSATATHTWTAAAAPAPPPQTVKWIDLDVGQCVAQLPHVDLGDVTVTVVDCATPHTAEVYLRAPMWVDTTVPDIANKQCAAGFPKYTGLSLAGSRYTVSYLVDAGQDRTGDVPNAPGTVICLLADANGQPLTGSAHH